MLDRYIITFRFIYPTTYSILKKTANKEDSDWNEMFIYVHHHHHADTKIEWENSSISFQGAVISSGVLMSCLNKLVIPQEIGPHAAEEFELVMFRNNKSVKNGPYVPYILYLYI